MVLGMERVSSATAARPVGCEAAFVIERQRYNASRHLGVFGHTYQPPREFQLVSQPSGVRADVVAQVNKKIHDECYKPVLIDAGHVPRGMVFSLYGTLREWMKAKKPDDFSRLVENVQELGDQAQWQVMGDSGIHLVMPLESRKTQDMLIRAGLKAFEQDMGFRPKGFWLPETAVSRQTLEVLAQNGIEFVVLHSSQVGDMNGHRVAYANLGRDDLKIAVLAVDSGISGRVSFEDDETSNAHEFLQKHSWRKDITYATDTEFYGHHRKGKDEFLNWVTREDVQAPYGVVPIDMEIEIANLKESPRYVDVYENTSWSDERGHNLGRWTGDCWCGRDNTEETIAYKKRLWQTISDYGREIDRRLDAVDPGWRAKFPDFFGAVRQSMYGAGDFHQDVAALSRQPGFTNLQDSGVRTLYLAELARLTGTTSCFNFFGGDRPERAIARINIGVIEELIPDITESRQLHLQQAA